MGSAFSKLKQRFRRRNSNGQDHTDGEANSVYREGLLKEVTEKSLLLDASKITSRKRSRQPIHHRYWKSPFERGAHVPPAVLSICINRDLGIGEITSLCHRFRLEDIGEPGQSETDKQNEGSGSRRSEEVPDRPSSHHRTNERSNENECDRRSENGKQPVEETQGEKEVEGSKHDRINDDTGKERKMRIEDEAETKDITELSEDNVMVKTVSRETKSSQKPRENQPSTREYENGSHVSLIQTVMVDSNSRKECEVRGKTNNSKSDNYEAGSRKVIASKTSEREVGGQGCVAPNNGVTPASRTPGNAESCEGRPDFRCNNMDEAGHCLGFLSDHSISGSLSDDPSSSFPITGSSNSSSPSEELTSSPTNESIDSNDQEIMKFPEFVTPFLNKDVRIRLQFHKAIHSTFNSTFKRCEPVHLWRHVKYIDARFLSQPFQKRIKIMLEESHGSRRKPFGNSRRSRPLFPRAIIINTCEETPGLYVAGKEFSILLAPPIGGHYEMEDGRVVYAQGTYVRYLDTDPNYLMLWRASIIDDVAIG